MFLSLLRGEIDSSQGVRVSVGPCVIGDFQVNEGRGEVPRPKVALRHLRQEGQI